MKDRKPFSLPYSWIDQMLAHDSRGPIAERPIHSPKQVLTLQELMQTLGKSFILHGIGNAYRRTREQFEVVELLEEDKIGQRLMIKITRHGKQIVEPHYLASMGITADRDGLWNRTWWVEDPSKRPNPQG